MKTSLFICQLSKQNQEKIKNEIINFLNNEGYGETETLAHLLMEMSNGVANVENRMEISPKGKNRITI